MCSTLCFFAGSECFFLKKLSLFVFPEYLFYVGLGDPQPTLAPSDASHWQIILTRSQRVQIEGTA